jgi:UDP-N-acetyl-D-glucosamine dehydrogenase
MNYAEELAEKIRARQVRAGVVGLGYVGLPLAVELAQAGFTVTGFDVQESKVRSIQQGTSYIQDIPDDHLAPLVKAGRLQATTDFASVAEQDTINICVPTPLRKTKDPDMSFVVSACEEVAGHLKPGTLVILESTTYPGTTEELVRPLLERDGRRVGHEIFLCFSPERVDPGNPQFQTRNIPKVVGGTTATCTQLATLLYSQALDHVVPVSSTQVAEMVKLLENTFRMINIGMVNELALMCRRMGIDVWEVIDAAATKPFGFMPFYPGPGLGGHCIPVDPFYLSWKSKQAGMEARFIELAGQINGEMPHHVVNRIQDALNDAEKPLKNSRVHILGVAYKKDIDDVRESPALDVALLLEQRGARVSYSDPFVPVLKLNERDLVSEDPIAASAAADCVVIVTNHSSFPYEAILQYARLIVDTRNALKGSADPKIVRL